MATQAAENIAADDKAPAGGVQPRSALLDDEITDDISVNNHEQQMKDRALLSSDEEKKLLRRVDFRLMILCAIIFMIKNVDANNVRISHLDDGGTNPQQAANARIMNKDTDRNIMTQLNMTADDYNWVSTVYNVSVSKPISTIAKPTWSTDSIHAFRDSHQHDCKEDASFQIPVAHHGKRPGAVSAYCQAVNSSMAH